MTNHNHHHFLENRTSEALTPANLRRLFLKHLEYTLRSEEHTSELQSH